MNDGDNHCADVTRVVVTPPASPNGPVTRCDASAKILTCLSLIHLIHRMQLLGMMQVAELIQQLNGILLRRGWWVEGAATRGHTAPESAKRVKSSRQNLGKMAV